MERPNAGRVLTLQVSGDSIVWFGTQGGGLGRFDIRTGRLRFFTTREGLPHNSVEGILEDRAGEIWVSTNRGVARFDPRTAEFWVFSEASGIQAGQFFANSAYESDDGHLYFGGPNGITVIDPSRLAPPVRPPPIALTRLLVGGEQRSGVTNYTAQSGIELRHDENFFTLQFAALDFNEPGQNRFRYRLENYEDQWVESGTGNSARYTRVPPGRYTFVVQARSGGGSWSSKGMVIPIVVRPAYYQALWFRALMLTALSAVIWLAYRYRMRQLDRVKAMRLQIAGELHDDIGANLSAIALKSDLVRRVASEDVRSQTALGDIHRLAQDTMQQVREMIWVVREEHDTIDGLLTRMEDSARILLGGVVAFKFMVDESVGDGSIEMELRQIAFRVFKEALQNVMKHARATQVRILVSFEEPNLHFAIVDDGCGFDADRVPVGTGLKLIRERAKRVGVRAGVTSSPGQGTRVDLTVRTG